MKKCKVKYKNKAGHSKQICYSGRQEDDDKEAREMMRRIEQLILDIRLMGVDA